MTGQQANQQAQQAKQLAEQQPQQTTVFATHSFYHDLVGSKAHGEVFQISDQTTLQALEQLGYVQKVDGQSQAGAQMSQLQQDLMKRQQEMGQAQALANEEVSQARHIQNMQSIQHTQQVNEQRQQQAQQNGQNYQTEVDKKAQQQQQQQFEPSAVSPKATAKKANENK